MARILQEVLDKFEGADVDKFDHIKVGSHYNSNYYHYNEYIMYGKSDDDHTTDWYLIRGSSQPLCVGSSSCLDTPEVIMTNECYRT